MLVTIPYVSSMSAHLPLLRLRRLEARLPRLQPEKIGTTRPPKEFTIRRQEARPRPQRPALHTSTTRRPLVAPPPPTSQTFPSRLASSRKNRPLQQWLRRSRHLHLRSIHPQHQFTGKKMSKCPISWPTYLIILMATVYQALLKMGSWTWGSLTRVLG